jgi:iron uptake system component EfeO
MVCVTWPGGILGEMPVDSRCPWRRARTALAVVLAGVLAGVLGAGCAAPAPSAAPAPPAPAPAPALPAPAPVPPTPAPPAPAPALPAPAPVPPTPAPPAPATAPAPVATDRYQAALVAEAAALQSATSTLTDAVRAGDLAAAKAAYQPAHRRYVAIEPLAEELDSSIDGRTDTGRATWTGFHRIEKALWVDGSLTAMTGYANALDLDVLALRGVVARAGYRPPDVAKMANDLLTACAVTMVTGEEERFAHTDLDDLATAVGAAYGAYATLRPALTDSGLVATIEARFAAVGRALAPYWRGDGYVDYTTVSGPERRRLAEVLDALAEPVSHLGAAVAPSSR